MRKTLVAALLVLPAGFAFADGNGVALKVGALGLGAEYTRELTERVSVRGAVYGSNLGFDAEESGIDYEFDVVWDSMAVGVDIHPLKTALRLSVGILKNDNGLDAVSRPAGNITVGDTVYTPAQVGTLEGGVSFDDTATFVGLGWDWSRKKRLFGMSFDLGLVDQGAPIVTLRGTGTLFGDPSFEQDIDAETAELADSLEDLDLVPYAAVGFVFRF